MTAGELAALIAAGFFAAGMCAAAYVLVKLAKLISAATAVLDGYRDGAENLLRRANAAVARADEQLARTGALADSVDQVSGAMSELSDEVTAVARTARLIATGLGAPALRVAAIGHGIRHAMALRSGARRTVRQLPARERAGR